MRKKNFFFGVLFIVLLNLSIESELLEDILNLKQIFCENWKDLMRHINFYIDTDDESLLDLELIDVVMKYVDLNDKDLKRNLPQIEKDIEMEKLNIILVQFYKIFLGLKYILLCQIKK